MRQSYRVLLNTGSLYAKIIANALVLLVSTRIALQVLGVDSYGLYNLVAGVISLLAFFNGALMVSAQRFLSFAIGENDERKIAEVFKISFLVHLVLASIVAVSLKSLQPFLFNGFLNIPAELIDVAKRVFDIMILSSFVTIFAIPYNAAINAREEMWFFSISEVLVSILKLGAAIYIYFANDDLLFKYSVLMLFAIISGVAVKYFWCIWRYSECRVKVKGKVDKVLFKEMFGFAGWNTLGSLTMVVRNQGVAVILNVFFGTVVNAAYGVANQLNALVITFAGTLTTVFTPMIVKARGEGDNEKMLFISIFSSKMAFLLSSFMALPVLLFTSFIFNLWLKVVPEYTVEFCQSIIVSFLIMQLYPGITRALYAEGNIKWYQIVISILLVSILPIGYLLFSLNFPPTYIFFVLIIAQGFTLIATIHFAKKKVNLNVRLYYVSSVFIPCMLFLGVFLAGFFTKRFLDIENEFLEFAIVSSLLLPLYSLLYWKLTFNTDETILLKTVYNSIKSKIIK